MNWKFFIAACLLFVSCTNKKTEENQVSVSPEYLVIKSENVNISGLKKDNEGYSVLFDGKSAEGWRGYGKDELPPKWKIKDNCLTLASGNDEGGDIVFGYNFKNFDLELEWKISKAGNSGIFYLAREVQTKDLATGEYKLQPIFISAPEYQILDNENHPDAKLGEDGNRKSGSLYDMIPAQPQSANHYGEWNKTRIVVNNGNVTHWLNGIQVVEYSFTGPQWIELLQSGKFGETKWPLAFELMKNCGGKKHEGYIGLQDHGDEVSFRNIRIKII